MLFAAKYNIIITIFMSTLFSGCASIRFNTFSGIKSVSRIFSLDEKEVYEGTIEYMHENDFVRIVANKKFSIIRGRYDFSGTESWSRTSSIMSKYTEPIGIFINPHGRNSFVQLNIKVSRTDNENKTKLILKVHFQTWGEPQGIGGVGPFSMDSKGVWEEQFLNDLSVYFNSRNKLAKENKESIKHTTYGTGFFISTDGYLLTNFHVVKNSEIIMVSLKGVEHVASLIKFDASNDIAILKVNGEYTALSIGDANKISLGESVFTIGFPNIDIQGSSPKLTQGVISSLNGYKDDPRLFQISVPINPGNSGGPLMTQSGKVIGITTASLSDLKMLVSSGTIPQNVNYAIKINYAKPLIGSCGIALDSDESKPAIDFQSAVKNTESAIAVIYAK